MYETHLFHIYWKNMIFLGTKKVLLRGEGV